MIKFFLKAHLLTFIAKVLQRNRIKVITKDFATFRQDVLGQALIVKFTAGLCFTIFASSLNAVDQ